MLVSATLGLSPDAPGRRLTVDPLRPAPFGAMTVTGLRVAGEPVSLSVDADGRVIGASGPDWLTVEMALG